jgi:hypothetical protein
MWLKSPFYLRNKDQWLFMLQLQNLSMKFVDAGSLIRCAFSFFLLVHLLLLLFLYARDFMLPGLCDHGQTKREAETFWELEAEEAWRKET